MPDQDIRSRFEAFVQTLDGFEAIDALLKENDPHGKKRADYFLWGRKVIIEQKVLEADPADKPQKFFDRLMKEGRFVAYGVVSSQEIFSKLPDGEELRRKLVFKLTGVLEAAVSEADKQTCDTREIFAVQGAVGMLVILNKEARMLDTELVRYRLLQLFRRTEPSGSARYPHNDIAIVISELHPVGNDPKVMPIEIFVNPFGKQVAAAQRFADTLVERWAKYNRVPLIPQNMMSQSEAPTMQDRGSKLARLSDATVHDNGETVSFSIETTDAKKLTVHCPPAELGDIFYYLGELARAAGACRGPKQLAPLQAHNYLTPISAEGMGIAPGRSADELLLVVRMSGFDLAFAADREGLTKQIDELTRVLKTLSASGERPH